MSTTAIFVELLIGGIQASLWVMLFVMSLTGCDWILKIAPYLEKWSTLVMVVVFAFWYTLGILIDIIAHAIFRLINPADILKRIRWIDHEAQYVADETALNKEEKSSERVSYVRSRVRIVRTTAINLFLIIIASVIFIFSQCSIIGCPISPVYLAFMVIGGGIILILITLIALGTVELTHEYRLTQAKDKTTTIVHVEK